MTPRTHNHKVGCVAIHRIEPLTHRTAREMVRRVSMTPPTIPKWPANFGVMK